VSTSKLGKNQWAELSPQKKNPFELPRLITRQLKQCAESHAAGRVAPVDNIKYLWVTFGTSSYADPEAGSPAERTLSADEWKNVVDEAASLGVNTVVIRVTNGMSRSEGLWDICQWAQKAHDMTVALFISDDFDLALLHDFSKLNPARTCLLAPQARFQETQPFADSGFKVCVADVGPGDRQMPCKGPRNMVYVSENGKLYPCGRVHGDEQYMMGDVLEDAIAAIRRNDSLPWEVDEHAGQKPCDACPNIMAKRMVGPDD